MHLHFEELGLIKNSDKKYLLSRCFFCNVIYNNSSTKKYKQKKHRDTKHSDHKNKSASFFKQQTPWFAEQSINLSC